MSDRQVVIRKQQGQIVVRKQQASIYKRFLKHLATQLGMSVGLLLSIVGLYNKYLLWQVNSNIAYIGTRSTQAVGEITKQSADNLLRIVTSMSLYLVQNPVEVASCAGNLYLDETQGNFADELKLVAKQLGQEGINKITTKAEKISKRIFADVVLPAISNRIELFKNLQLPSSETSLIRIPDTTQMIVEQEEVQEIQTRQERIEAESSIQVGLREQGCKLMNWLDSNMPKNLAKKLLSAECTRYLIQEKGLASIHKQCPRLYQDIKTIAEREIEDFSFRAGNSLKYAVQDIDISINRSFNDVMSTVRGFAIFLFLFIFLYFIYRIIFGNFVDKVRRAVFGMSGKRSVRKSKRRSRKRSVRKSKRKSRKRSVRKSKRRSR